MKIRVSPSLKAEVQDLAAVMAEITMRYLLGLVLERLPAQGARRRSCSRGASPPQLTHSSLPAGRAWGVRALGWLGQKGGMNEDRKDHEARRDYKAKETGSSRE